MKHYFFEVYLLITSIITGFLSYYYKIECAFLLFFLATCLDTVTRIHADAKAKKLKFNPLKKYFWREIKSEGLRNMLEKMIMQYGTYLFIVFLVDQLVFTNKYIVNVYGEELTLPVCSLYIFAFIEFWSVGENIDEAGGINFFKRIFHLLPEKIQKIIQPDESN